MALKRTLGIFVCLCMLFYATETRPANRVGQSEAADAEKRLKALPHRTLGEILKEFRSSELGSVVDYLPDSQFKMIIRSIPSNELGSLVRDIPVSQLKPIYKSLGIPTLFLKPILAESDSAIGSVVKALPGSKLAGQIKQLPLDELGELLANHLPSDELGRQIDNLSSSIIVDLLMAIPRKYFDFIMGYIPKDVPIPTRPKSQKSKSKKSKSKKHKHSALKKALAKSGSDAVANVLGKVGPVEGLLLGVHGVVDELGDGSLIENSDGLLGGVIGNNGLVPNAVGGLIGALGR